MEATAAITATIGGATERIKKVDKYIEALKGISYSDWVKLRMCMDEEFDRQIGEAKKQIRFNGVEKVKRTIRHYIN